MTYQRKKAYISLYILLLLWAILYSFPLLGVKPISATEVKLLEYANTLHGEDLVDVLEGWNCSEVALRSYCYIVNLFKGLFDGIDDVFWLRFPTATIMTILTMCLFRYDGEQERLGYSFTSSLIFMSCAYVSLMVRSASIVILPSLFVILTFVSLSHWARVPKKRNTILFCIAQASTIVFVGHPIVFMTSIMGLACLAIHPMPKVKNIVKYLLAMLGSVLLAYLFVYIITADKGLANSMLADSQMLSSAKYNEANSLYKFVVYMLFTLFPWSIPMLMEVPTLFRNPKQVVESYNQLPVAKQFGAVLFLLSIPAMFVYSHFSFALILACVFFNSPIIGSILLSQYQSHPKWWKIIAMSVVIAISVEVIVYMMLCMDYEIAFINNKTITSWHWLSICLVIGMIISLYTLNRNWREIRKNNRFFYNVIILYLLGDSLMTAFILPNIYIGL